LGVGRHFGIKEKKLETDFIEETDEFLKECGRTAYDIAKEAGISPVLLNSYMSERIAKRSRVENMRLKIFVRLWPIVEKWKQEQDKVKCYQNSEENQ